jgi:hypothetical protein
MDAKERWPVVKFLVAATGLNRRDARAMIDEIPEEKWSKLWIEAQVWNRDTDRRASETLSTVLGDERLNTLVKATRLAQQPAGAEAAEAPPPKKRRK